MSQSHLVVLAAAAAAALVSPALAAKRMASLERVPTPMGYMLKDCVYAFPSGATVELVEEGFRVTPAGSLESYVESCSPPPGVPMLVPNTDGMSDRKALRTPGSGGYDARHLQLPKDYDGWEEYAANQTNVTGGYGSFLGYFSVPATPASDPAVLYLFTGLQNINWIPRVMPEPTAPFDIIQPVLQYPGDGGNYWSVKSWWVTLDKGAGASTEVQMQPGQNVFGNMTKIGAASWFINSVNTANNQATSIIAKGLGTRLAAQPWAYITLECYGCSGCSTYPSGNSPCVFSQMSLADVNGEAISPVWAANPFPSTDRKCNESIALYNATTAAIFFGN